MKRVSLPVIYSVCIDPWSGKYISVDELKKLYEGAFGFGATIQPEDLARADIPMLTARFRQLAKNAGN